ncbi:MAG: UDP-N-acetylmuramoyl-L-alanyl-D-glutamate--2,6-diaminopimelate ligase [Campylobacterales bacterium]|nr:UDP-N-acetylmuramoyl-L-alanyl-D-glutamate--2,6-diaminopimelate ligase [Campylobacterales bacterium]
MILHIKSLNLNITDNSKEASVECAFLATKSNNKYIESAKSNGCRTILTPTQLLKKLNLPIKIVGITGTNGKTTTAGAIYSILLDLGFKVAMQGTRGFFLNDERVEGKSLTTPQSLDIINHLIIASEKSCEFFVMEVSSHAIEQLRVEGLNFALKIHTNITSDHLDYHKTLKNYIDVKNSFFEDESVKLINKDDPLIKFNFKNSYTYAIENASVFKVEAYSLKDGISALIKCFEERAELHSSLVGIFNLYNLLAAISAVKILTNKNLDEICEMAENFGGVSGRVEKVSEEPLIFVDFAHTTDGMKKIFELFPQREITVIFGAGGDRDKTKRPLMGRIAEMFAKKIYITSDNPRSENPLHIIEDILNGIENKTKVSIFLDRKEAICKAIDNLNSHEVLLILGKGDEEYQEINGIKYPFSDSKIVTDYLKTKN